MLIIATVALTWWLIQPLDREWGPKMASEKVEPSFAGRLLLAPNGTVWLGNYQDNDGKTTVSCTSFLPGNDWKQLSGSEEGGLAIKEDGSLWMWLTTREEGPGQIKAAPDVFHLPARVGGDSNWAKGMFSWRGALLLKNDGSLWVLDRYRYLGSGFPYNRPSVPIKDLKPVQVGSDNDWSDLLSAQEALKRDGTIWSVTPPYGFEKATTTELMYIGGDWARTPSSYPRVGLKRDGSLWVGGQGANTIASDFAQPPVSPNTDWVEPHPVGSDTDWVNLAVGPGNLVAQKRDGSWWATGNNHFSQLGFPHWFGHSKHLTRPKRIPIKLDVVAWKIEMYTTTLLTSRGNICYLGKRPLGTMRPSKFKRAVNDFARRSQALLQSSRSQMRIGVRRL